MDFPFEYIERVYHYPNFTKLEENRRRRYDYPESEEIEEDRKYVPPNFPNEENLRKEIDSARKKVRKRRETMKVSGENKNRTEKQRIQLRREREIRTSSEEEISLDDTHISGPRLDPEVIMKRFRDMQHCACTDSACSSASPPPGKDSSISTSCSSLRGAITGETKASTEESSTSSDENWADEEELSYLEKIQEVDGNEENTQKDSMKSEMENNDDDDEIKNGETFEDITNSLEMMSSLTSSSSSSPSPLSSESTQDNHISSDPEILEDDMQEFNWDSEDLYNTSETDVVAEQDIQHVLQAMKNVKPIFENVSTPKLTELEIQKLQNFAQILPHQLATQRIYKMLEEPKNSREVAVISRNLWLCQQMDNGRMCSARLVSRKHPDDVRRQKTLNNERLVLMELLPELSEPSHLLKMIDAGATTDFKFLIFEDVGMSLLSLFQEFGRKFNDTTMFLLSYFTFASIRELHRFGFIHTDIRPSVFSVIQYPFNVKITDYGRTIQRSQRHRVSEDVRPDSFCSRVFHKRNAFFDSLVDIESWIYTMLFISPKSKMPWFGKEEGKLQLKEKLMRNPLSSNAFRGCPGAVVVAAKSLQEKGLTYEQFMTRIDYVFSVDVMQFPDTAQPLIWSFREVEKLPPRFARKADHWDESHWNPADHPHQMDEKIRRKEQNQLEKELEKTRAYRRFERGELADDEDESEDDDGHLNDLNTKEETSTTEETTGEEKTGKPLSACESIESSGISPQVPASPDSPKAPLSPVELNTFLEQKTQSLSPFSELSSSDAVSKGELTQMYLQQLKNEQKRRPLLMLPQSPMSSAPTETKTVSNSDTSMEISTIPSIVSSWTSSDDAFFPKTRLFASKKHLTKWKKNGKTKEKTKKEKEKEEEKEKKWKPLQSCGLYEDLDDFQKHQVELFKQLMDAADDSGESSPLLSPTSESSDEDFLNTDEEREFVLLMRWRQKRDKKLERPQKTSTDVPRKSKKVKKKATKKVEKEKPKKHKPKGQKTR